MSGQQANTVGRRLKAVWAAALLLLPVGTLCGQEYRILPREQLDSVAHPVAAADSPLHFERTHIDAGTLGEADAPSEYRWRWRNEGDRPVVITAVTTSCGCAVARYDREPVAPGREGTITVTYHPKGHPGWFNRKVLVYTQHSRQPQAVLELTGRVTPAALPTRAYRYACGPLRLKQTQVRMEGTRRSVERIEVLNAGDEPLHLGVDTAALPRCLRVGCEPDPIPPGARADLEVAFDPERVTDELPGEVAIRLTGLGPMAEEPYIRVRFGEERVK